MAITREQLFGIAQLIGSPETQRYSAQQMAGIQEEQKRKQQLMDEAAFAMAQKYGGVAGGQHFPTLAEQATQRAQADVAGKMAEAQALDAPGYQMPPGAMGPPGPTPRQTLAGSEQEEALRRAAIEWSAGEKAREYATEKDRTDFEQSKYLHGMDNASAQSIARDNRAAAEGRFAQGREDKRTAAEQRIYNDALAALSKNPRAMAAKAVLDNQRLVMAAQDPKSEFAQMVLDAQQEYEAQRELEIEAAQKRYREGAPGGGPKP